MSTLKVTNITPQSGQTVYLTGSLEVSNTLIAREVRTTISSSEVLVSGSTKFGDSLDDTHTFTGSVSLTGSLSSKGLIDLNNIPWPETGSEYHLLRTDPYTLNSSSGSRDYTYIGIGLEHFEDNNTFHNSLLLYTYDDHHAPGGPNYGSEINVGPLRNHMRVWPSQSVAAGLDTNHLGNISVEDVQDGTSRALLYADSVQIGVFNSEEIEIGNTGTNSLNLTSQNSKIFNNNLRITSSISTTGSFMTNGVVSFEKIPWPVEGEEHHLFETNPFTIDTLASGDRDYEYLGVALEHGSASLGGYKHHSLSIYAFDDHDIRNYGAEMNVGPLRTHMRIFPSGSSGDFGNVSVEDLYNGTSRTNVYGTQLYLGAITTTEIIFGNLASSLEQQFTTATFSGSLATFITPVEFTGSVNITGSFTLPNHADVDSTLTSLNAATSSYATSATHISVGELKALVSSSATYNDFTASVLAL